MQVIIIPPGLPDVDADAEEMPREIVHAGLGAGGAAIGTAPGT